MNQAIEEMIERYFPRSQHPYRQLMSVVRDAMRKDHTVLDIGCGRTAPMLVSLGDHRGRLIGIDLVDFESDGQNLTLFRNDVCDMKDVEDGSVDLCYSRSVMEHVKSADRAFSEISRVLRSGGTYVFLTPNFWHYSSLIAHMIPNRFHKTIVRRVEGRDEDDTFPTYYRANTRRSITTLAAGNGLGVKLLDYLTQYPNYLLFNKYLFWAGCQYERTIQKHKSLHPLSGWILGVLEKA